jgi:fatty-acyl-CoA synthase
MTPETCAAWPKHLPRSLERLHRPVHLNLRLSASSFPDRPLCIFYGASLSYSQALRQTEWFAGFLVAHCAIRPGDRVLLLMQNCPQFIIAFYGALRAGAVVVPINPMSVAEEIAYFAEDSGACVFVVAQDLYTRVEPLLDAGRVRHTIVVTYSDYLPQVPEFSCPIGCTDPPVNIGRSRVTAWSRVLGERLNPAHLESAPDRLCVLPYTSGSTGHPKACMHTHASVMTTVVSGATWLNSPSDQPTLATLPYFHVTGMQFGMNVPVYSGRTIVLLQRWDAKVAIGTIEKYRIGSWVGITSMVIDVLTYVEQFGADLSSLHVLFGGGASMPEAVSKRLTKVCGVNYVEGYGLTETMAPTHINPPSEPRPGSIGVPIFDTDSRVIEPGTCHELGPRTLGEIVIAGDQVLLGYWNNPAATEDAFVELGGRRFLRTGDLGWFDEDGYFYLVDRLKRMINAAGFKVSPAEVEALLYRHTAVQEACVVAAPDPDRGETVKAFVVLRKGNAETTTEADLVTWSRTQMAAYKIPRVVQFVDSLPKSATGKIKWKQLQDREFGR